MVAGIRLLAKAKVREVLFASLPHGSSEELSGRDCQADLRVVQWLVCGLLFAEAAAAYRERHGVGDVLLLDARGRHGVARHAPRQPSEEDDRVVRPHLCVSKARAIWGSIVYG